MNRDGVPDDVPAKSLQSLVTGEGAAGGDAAAFRNCCLGYLPLLEVPKPAVEVRLHRREVVDGGVSCKRVHQQLVLLLAAHGANVGVEEAERLSLVFERR